MVSVVVQRALRPAERAKYRCKLVETSETLVVVTQTFMCLTYAGVDMLATPLRVFHGTRASNHQWYATTIFCFYKVTFILHELASNLVYAF